VRPRVLVLVPDFDRFAVEEEPQRNVVGQRLEEDGDP
jgi:hypothetical protein